MTGESRKVKEGECSARSRTKYGKGSGGVGTGGHLSLNMPSGSLSQANFLDLSQIDFSQDNEPSEVTTSTKVDLLSQDSAYIGASDTFAASQIII